MDNFRVIYKILTALEQSMDGGSFDMESISADEMGISQHRLSVLWAMLGNVGYVKGINEKQPRITLKGLEYLQENSLMRKAASLAKGIGSQAR